MVDDLVVTPLCICTCHVHPPPLPPSSFLVPFPYSAPPNTHMHTITKAVVLFDYEKQEDDELSLKVGDIITDVKQVCAVNALKFSMLYSGMLYMYVYKLNQVCLTCIVMLGSYRMYQLTELEIGTTTYADQFTVDPS